MWQVVPYNGDTTDQEMQSLEPRGSSKYRGLSNQGATCYMNSLLQSLYMAPEFRRKVYSWKYEEEKDGDKADSIPFQLQVLFGKLQSASVPYVETKNLTKSFGWDIREGFQQHDVQEFCRVLFDAIEQSVVGSENEKMINSMYEGVMTDYVKCLNCQHESSRKDKFLDLSLTVWNEFDKIYNDSVEKALYNYVKPDKLTDDNKYFCENCNSKQDALKGLKFEKFPYILMLQLKRFDLDYITMQRIKLNDKVTFPQVLNLNPLVKSENPPETESVPEEEPEEENKEEQQPTLVVEPSDLETRNLVRTKTTGFEYVRDDRDKKPLKMDPIAKEKLIEKQTEERRQKQKLEVEKYSEEGEYVYELFSIMIHSGSALGGHYYAYIKDLEDGKWYNFNDTLVKEIEEKEIQKVYGGKKETGWNSGYSANAYLLMYRQVRADNINQVEDSEIPKYISEEIEEQKEKDRLEAIERVEKYKIMTIKVFYEKNEKGLKIKKDQKFKELKELAVKSFEVDLKPENVRLRGYSVYYDTLQDEYDEEKTLEEQGIWNYKTLALETKDEGEEWTVYDPNMITVKVNLWEESLLTDPRSLDEKTSEPMKISISKKQTLEDFMKKLEDETKIPFEKQKILKKTFSGVNTHFETISNKSSMQQTLTFAKIYEGSVLFLEELDNSSKSKWQELISKEASRYKIRFNHPDEVSNFYGQVDYNKHYVVVDCNSKIQVLKEQISKQLSIPEDELVMRRGGKQCQEIKDLELKLTQANFCNNSVVYLERGQPTKANEYRIIFSLAVSPDDTVEDAMCYKFYSLFDLPINASIKVLDLKEKLVKNMKEMYPSMELETSHLRLRERNSERLSRVLKNHDLFRAYALFEKKNVSVQLLDQEEPELKSTEIILVVKQWFPSSWEISAPHEIVVSKQLTIHEFGEKLSGIFSVPLEYLEIAKVTYSWNFARSDLEKEKFYKAEDNKNNLGNSPWYVTLDGVLFFVKDTREAMRDLTEEERSKWGKASQVSYNFSPSWSYSPTWKYEPPKEESVKITVKKKQQDKPEEVEEEQN